RSLLAHADLKARAPGATSVILLNNGNGIPTFGRFLRDAPAHHDRCQRSAIHDRNPGFASTPKQHNLPTVDPSELVIAGALHRGSQSVRLRGDGRSDEKGAVTRRNIAFLAFTESSAPGLQPTRGLWDFLEPSEPRLELRVY